MNKSLVAMRKAGLVKGTAFNIEHKRMADDYVMRAWEYSVDRDEATHVELHQSYLLGLRGIRIGQEALHNDHL